jgi:hypothetical protein
LIQTSHELADGWPGQWPSEGLTCLLAVPPHPDLSTGLLECPAMVAGFPRVRDKEPAEPKCLGTPMPLLPYHPIGHRDHSRVSVGGWYSGCKPQEGGPLFCDLSWLPATSAFQLVGRNRGRRENAPSC